MLGDLGNRKLSPEPGRHDKAEIVWEVEDGAPKPFGLSAPDGRVIRSLVRIEESIDLLLGQRLQPSRTPDVIQKGVVGDAIQPGGELAATSKFADRPPGLAVRLLCEVGCEVLIPTTEPK